MKSILLQTSADDPAIVGIIAFIVVLILLFFALRGLVLWYYKIDVMSKNLEEQTKTQKRILEILEMQLQNNRDKY